MEGVEDEGDVLQDTTSSFADDVHKEILTEAPPEAWHHPRLGDVVTVEADAGVSGGGLRTWTLGAGVPAKLSGVDVDRCVCTMRHGERASFREKKREGSASFTLRLLGHERSEDILGDGRLIRTTLQEGTGWQTPKAGTELRVRFSWQLVASQPAASLQEATASSSSTAGSSSAAAGVSPEAVEAALISILLEGSPEQCEEALASRQLADLRRGLLQRFSGTVVSEAKNCAEASALQLRVSRGGVAIAAADGTEVFSGPEEALLALQDALQSPGVDAVPANARWQASKEVTISVHEGRCVCSAEDWIPGYAGLRVLEDLRLGQRCLVKVSPEVAFGTSGPPEVFGQLPTDGATLAYDLELLQIFTFEDTSLDRSGRVTKKLIREGEGYERPAEGATVTVSIQVTDDTGSTTLVDERELTCEAASGRFCSAVEETVLTMKRGEACEVRCSDPQAYKDAELGLQEGGSVLIALKLLDFEKLDAFSSDEAQRVAYCSRRKEVGTSFFQQGKWRQALKRYQCVTSNLGYLDSWKDAACISQAKALRKACHLNRAACWLKLEAWCEAEQACAAVLDDEPDNVKALFRRGQALKELKEYRKAEQSLRKVIALDKSNKEAARLLLQLRQSVKSEVEQQKEMFSRMARGIGETQQVTGPDAGATNGSSKDEAVHSENVASNGKAGDLLKKVGEDETNQVDEEDDDDTIIWALGLTVALLACASAGYYFLRRR